MSSRSLSTTSPTGTEFDNTMEDLDSPVARSLPDVIRFVFVAVEDPCSDILGSFSSVAVEEAFCCSKSSAASSLEVGCALAMEPIDWVVSVLSPAVVAFVLSLEPEAATALLKKLITVSRGHKRTLTSSFAYRLRFYAPSFL